AGAEREIVASVRNIDYLGAIEARRHHNGGHRVGIPLGLLGAKLEAPYPNRGAGGAGQIMMSGEEVLEAILLHDVERPPQAMQERQRRRIREVAGGVRLDLIVQIEVSVPAIAVLHRGNGLPARAHDAETGGKHEALLRAGDGEVDAPIVEAEIDAADR